MAEITKRPKTYNLSPTVTAWVTQKAARLTLESGRQISDSELANDILVREMAKDLGREDVASMGKIVKAAERQAARLREKTR